MSKIIIRGLVLLLTLYSSYALSAQPSYCTAIESCLLPTNKVINKRCEILSRTACPTCKIDVNSSACGQCYQTQYTTCLENNCIKNNEDLSKCGH